MSALIADDFASLLARADRSDRRRACAVLVVGVIAAAGAGLLAVRAPVACLGLLVGGALAAAVWRQPAVAAYAIIGITPLVVGIDRGRLVPQMRVNEALTLFLVGVLCMRAVLQGRPWRLRDLRLDSVSRAFVWFAIASSLIPIVFMVARGRPLEMDDLTYAVVMWKFLLLYVVVRLTVRSQREVTIALWVSMIAGVLVGVIGILQSLDLLGVRALLEPLFAPFGYTDVVSSARAGSTVGLPAATADLMVLNLVIALGMLYRKPALAWCLAPMTLVFVVAVFSAAEFSSALGLVIALVCVAVRLRRLDLLRWSVLALPVAVAGLWPTIAPRIADFSSLHGMPTSWLVRYHNLTTYFWPQIVDGSNFLVGVRPAARVPVDEGAFGFIWIESGYLWLLWGGGLPLFAAFCWFVWRSLKATGPPARLLATPSAVAALAAYTGLVSCVVLMIFDPHITYRGSADALFGLLALSACGHQVVQKNRRQQHRTSQGAGS
ncbi:hypothetical protein [Aeromicrobium ginsengisoli]|uniref:O-antigen ligase family protein n=1 Tax=Aeromicrobium ginsengisoli TaxID=363867 RepID=A0A5M4FF28_9ACTN|nr:hypothetical protein [Aeromicrobium ginsengisoli]KAA1397726.1 hypothetical protein ESP70_010260 [Aeromicrobium ginsengisoli]